MKSDPVSKPLTVKTPTPPAVHLQTIGPEEAGQRLDNYLLRWAKGVPKSHVYRIIRSGEVRVNKKRAEPTTRLIEGDVVRVPPVRIAEPAQMAAVNTAQTKSRARGYSDKMPILFEDEALLIVDKPPGLAVHGGSGIALGVIETLRITRPELKFLELVHRLDRDTSGVLLLAKKRSALVELHRQIREGQTDKRYYLLAHGEIQQGAQVMQLKYPLHKYLLANGERRVRVDPEGLPSHTALRVTQTMKRDDVAITLAEAQLKTGRTHQIRVHLQKLGHAILGDDKYGFEDQDKLIKSKRLYLHAHLAGFTHPRTGEKIRIESPLPAEFAAMMKGFEKTES
ncbi:RNA pseudouridine synthase [Polynucleobacter sp. QLW-P1DATA-2]|jgi:23S rRNA pseudouridine955/2504/2580 synthase|uniref:RluA family pseudouridine synthase n=1 Tax=unclassified Polynucleobacter TaxID=2640945 RepID=UPI0008F8257F|nr:MULTISPECIES: RluA family pseudouridine synthase [unclassified Polynucleobacter]OIN00972.1 RNA pseudouridine synthase [Polynucleobacter sp. QLW-P1DATA-2]OIN02533.1 RNA pseudouridine synthase [Polynucleobacter sp. MWH-Tro8-2-5-gr]